MIDFAIVIVFLLISRYRVARIAAFIFVTFQLIYMFTVVPLAALDWELYFKINAVVNLLVGLLVYNHDKDFAKLSFLMIPVSCMGYILCYYNCSPVVYDTLSYTIIILQALVLVVRILTSDGYVRGRRKRSLVRLADFHRYKQSGIPQARAQ